MSKRPRDGTSWHPPLDADDIELWNELKKSVKRIRFEEGIALPVKAKAPAKIKQEKTEPPPLKAAPVKKVSTAVPDSSFDRMALRKIKTGRVKVDDSIDLHGMRQEAAHLALESFILGARARGCKLVLVVTGKGNRFGSSSEGVLKKNVPHWLKDGEMARAILSFSLAAIQHGGDGAFYVRLRKKR